MSSSIGEDLADPSQVKTMFLMDYKHSGHNMQASHVKE